MARKSKASNYSTINPRSAEVERLRVEIRHMGDGPDQGEWLRVFYNRHAQQVLADSERIWGTGSILLPLALSAFGALATIEEISWFKLLLLAFASVVLTWVWLLTAEHHRSSLNKSLAWLEALEKTAGIGNPGDGMLHQNRLARWAAFSKEARQAIRWLMAILVVLLWSVIIVSYWFVPSIIGKLNE